MSGIGDRDIEKFFSAMKIMSPRLKKVAENEQAKGRAGFRLLKAIAMGMSIDVARIFRDCGYDESIQAISIDEIEKAAKQAGYESAKELIADSEDGENMQAAKRRGYI